MQSDDQKYIKIVYNTLRNDTIDKPACTNLCSLLKHLLQPLVILDAWGYQTISDVS